MRIHVLMVHWNGSDHDSTELYLAPTKAGVIREFLTQFNEQSEESQKYGGDPENDPIFAVEEYTQGLPKFFDDCETDVYYRFEERDVSNA